MLVCPSGGFIEVVIIEECHVDLVEDHCRSVCASCLDPIVYFLYGTIPNTKQSVQLPGKCIIIHS